MIPIIKNHEIEPENIFGQIKLVDNKLEVELSDYVLLAKVFDTFGNAGITVKEMKRVADTGERNMDFAVKQFTITHWGA